MRPITVTVYVPLCGESCSFCERLTVPSTLRSVTRYSSALIAEIDSVAPDLRDYEVQAVRFCGGIPLLLGGTSVSDILFNMRKAMTVADDAEITIETVPGKLDEYNLRLFAQRGIERLEFNVATLVQSEHNDLRCPGVYGQLYEHDAMRHYLGPENWGVNLLYGLAGQTPDSWKRTVRKALDMEPRHVAIALSRALPSGTPSERARIGGYAAFSDDELDTLLAMREAAVEQLVNAGYHEYVAGSFSLSESRCRHTELAYRCADSLGLGAGATSLYGGYSYRNTSDVEAYMNHSSEPERIVRDVFEIDWRARLLSEVGCGLCREGGWALPSLADGLADGPGSGVSDSSDVDCEEATKSLGGIMGELAAAGFVERLAGGSYRLTGKGDVCRSDVFESVGSIFGR